jgi:prepilin signal peptidase PulO-like enzyme (type II secretory pathway)
MVMGPLTFFLAGLPLAFVANKLVVGLTDFEEELVEESDARALPWHKGQWPARVRWLVLMLVPVTMAIAAMRFDLPQAFAVSLLLVALLVITATDILRFRVPNAVTYPATLTALLAATLMPGGSVESALLAAALGGGVFFLLAVITGGGIGLGDVKLAVLIGAALGLPLAYQALIYGVIAAAVVMGLMLLAGIVHRRQAVPYAPFLALAAIAFTLAQGTTFAPL